MRAQEVTSDLRHHVRRCRHHHRLPTYMFSKLRDSPSRGSFIGTKEPFTGKQHRSGQENQSHPHHAANVDQSRRQTLGCRLAASPGNRDPSNARPAARPPRSRVCPCCRLTCRDMSPKNGISRCPNNRMIDTVDPSAPAAAADTKSSPRGCLRTRSACTAKRRCSPRRPQRQTGICPIRGSARPSPPTGQPTRRLQGDQHQDDQGKEPDHRSAEVVDAVDRAEPVRCQRHHPVEGRKGDRQAEQQPTPDS